MTSDKPEDAPAAEQTESATEPSQGDELEPTHGRTVGQGVEPATPEKSTPPRSTEEPKRPGVRGQTRISAAFVALAIGIVVLVLLLIFILQNNETTTVRYFGAEGHLPLGVLLLFAAAGGALLVVIFGAARIIQLHWLARMDRRSGKKP
ncbi:lipopolysaccharide assembly LapA domain-containing protein [Microlunatus sp. Gsoil 973]|jgi:uncharacterized integral membrane protein|uniref:LapA family protein n=1 Tax=Microlunatus sp. Gsoil 973 TaxID=2672569 RepID=UPI0012B4DA53|nr:LapA family protein [Microlunatus sp. Gsoil 973]QGN34514.1 DUF1049 domain-containing protein [Microlunatus sp. Gsoil 973]